MFSERHSYLNLPRHPGIQLQSFIPSNFPVQNYNAHDKLKLTGKVSAIEDIDSSLCEYRLSAGYGNK